MALGYVIARSHVTDAETYQTRFRMPLSGVRKFGQLFKGEGIANACLQKNANDSWGIE